MGRWYRFTSGSWVGQDGATIGTSTDEYHYWQDRAALLDPEAYAHTTGAAQTITVPGGENWYLLSAWYVQTTGGGLHDFHRQAHYEMALPLPAGKSITTHASNAGSSIYVCKPKLVIDADSRYVDDPKGLYYERLRRMASELTQYTIGMAITDNTSPTAAFPTDFTNGLVMHATQHDLAWIALSGSAANGALAILNEISDDDRSRFAETCILPFKRTTFDVIEARGASESEGRGTVTYCKLPADW